MDRLNCLRCEYEHKENGNCTAVGGFCTAVPAAYCKKLQEYMDLGLTPEEIKSALDADAIIKLCAQALGVSADRLREMAAADRDGRAVVLPCKVGDKVWMHEKTLVRGEIVNSVELEALTEMRGNALNPVWFFAGDRDFSPSEIGKNVFLTRAEAEAAMKEREEQK